jgi:hypothetical protein
MARLAATAALRLVIILAMAALVLVLLASMLIHAQNPAEVLIQPGQMQTIFMLELVGIALSAALGKGKPMLRLRSKSKEREDPEESR